MGLYDQCASLSGPRLVCSPDVPVKVVCKLHSLSWVCRNGRIRKKLVTPVVPPAHTGSGHSHPPNLSITGKLGAGKGKEEEQRVGDELNVNIICASLYLNQMLRVV
ncbi:hypothetical protein E2C01_072111 [Portunus trituberculatus]|uniref:Uncharacterized protein n=1 Tax=Portunus trituberculatus TaxID=210409 RepID=A0A5B7I1S4_PORTR|nr:hypothetical protein [Portunus trituberculatus]